jgi:hypothetical protein
MNRDRLNTARLGTVALLPVVETVAADILASFLLSCSSGRLTDDFGEIDPLWYPKFFRDEDEISDDVQPPYLVVAVDVVGEMDPPTYDGDTVQPQWLRVDVFADTKAESIRLAREVLNYFRYDPDGESDAPKADPLEWQDGFELFREINRSNPEPIGAQRGPGGRIVSGSRVRIEFMTQFNIFGV